MKKKLTADKLVFFQKDSTYYYNSTDAVIDTVNTHDLDSISSINSAYPDTVGDSSLQKLSSKKLVPSVLQKHDLQPGSITPNKLNPGNEDWIAIHLIVGLIVLAWTRFFYAKRLKQIFKSLMGIRFQGMLEREGNVFRERIGLSLIFIYLISFSLLIYLVFTRLLNFQIFSLSSFKMFSLIMLLVIISWILKNILSTFIGKVFKNPVVYSEYALTNFIFNITLGCILFPIVILTVYLPSTEILYFGIGIWTIAFVYRIVRLLLTSISFTKFSLFNRILYLCTFEIAPIFVLIKLIMSYLG